jgi:hypothetical protein
MEGILKTSSRSFWGPYEIYVLDLNPWLTKPWFAMTRATGKVGVTLE